jgi:protein involved in polysaccharide export with SLBB domain
MNFKSVSLSLILCSAFFSLHLSSQVAELSKEFLEGLPASVRDEVEVRNEIQEDSDIDKLFQSETSLDKNKILLQKLKKQMKLLDQRFEQLEGGSSNKSELSKFGSEFFSSLQSSFMPINIPNLSDDYILGVGDAIDLSLTSGGNGPSKKYSIGRDNAILVSGYGKIYLGGLTLAEAEKKVFSFFALKAPAITPFMQVVNQRDIQVLVMGYVESPGIYTLSSGASIIGALDVAGGVSSQGSYRKIEQKRNGVTIHNIDLYDLFAFGNFDLSAKLRSGDVLYVNPSLITIPVTGGVNNEAIFEVNTNESIEDVITFAGGFSQDNIGFDSVTLARSSLGDVKFFEIEKKLLGKTYFAPRDALIVPSYKNAIDPKVVKTIEIQGRVKAAGKYTFVDGDKISDIIKRAGGYEDNAYIFGAALFRESAKEQEEIYAQLNYSDTVNFIISNIGKPGASVNASALDLLAEELRSKRFEGRIIANFDLDRISLNPELNLELRDGDIITIPPLQKVVYMFGDFRNPSNATYDPNLKISDYIKLSGGTKESAYSEIIIIDPDGKTHILDSSLFSALAKDITVYPGTIIYAPRNIGKLTGVMYASTVSPILSSLAISLASLNSITK